MPTSPSCRSCPANCWMRIEEVPTRLAAWPARVDVADLVQREQQPSSSMRLPRAAQLHAVIGALWRSRPSSRSMSRAWCCPRIRRRRRSSVAEAELVGRDIGVLVPASPAPSTPAAPRRRRTSAPATATAHSIASAARARGWHAAGAVARAAWRCSPTRPTARPSSAGAARARQRAALRISRRPTR